MLSANPAVLKWKINKSCVRTYVRTYVAHRGGCPPTLARLGFTLAGLGSTLAKLPPKGISPKWAGIRGFKLPPKRLDSKDLLKPNHSSHSTCSKV